jgi:hypothetical protein
MYIKYLKEKEKKHSGWIQRRCPYLPLGQLSEAEEE